MPQRPPEEQDSESFISFSFDDSEAIVLMDRIGFGESQESYGRSQEDSDDNIHLFNSLSRYSRQVLKP